MGSWAGSPVQDANLRGNSAVSITDSLTEQHCDLARVTPLLCAYFLRWIRVHQVAKYRHHFKTIRLSEQKFLRNYKKGKNSDRGGCVPQSIRNEADHPCSRHQQEQRAGKKQCPHGFLDQPTTGEASKWSHQGNAKTFRAMRTIGLKKVHLVLSIHFKKSINERIYSKIFIAFNTGQIFTFFIIFWVFMSICIYFSKHLLC